MSEYRHGAYADLLSTTDYTSPPGVGTIPVYIGRAPLHQLKDSAKKVGIPLLITSYNQAIKQIGYSDDWKQYELCEAVYAHFKNNVQSVGPIIVINALDPETMRAKAEQTAQLQFLKRKAFLKKPQAILSTVRLAEKTQGIDYQVEYAEDGSGLLFRDLKGGLETIDATFYEVDPSAAGETEIIAALRKGLPRVYYDPREVPTLLCAPGWSAKKAVYEALVESAEKINGHWYAYINADLDCESAKTIDAAILAKEGYEITAAASSLLWPMGKRGTRIFHASVLNTVTMQRVDFQNDNLPFETPSNKQVDIDATCLADGTPIEFDQTQANRLNAAGIDTMTYWEGQWRMWGPHTALFTHEKPMDQRDIFDCSVRMVRFAANSFQRRYGNDVDKPMTRARKDTILNDFQEQLDRWKSNGALLLGTIEFIEEENDLSDLVQGNFVFTVEVTNPLPGKSLTSKVRWTSKGMTTLYGGEQDE